MNCSLTTKPGRRDIISGLRNTYVMLKYYVTQKITSGDKITLRLFQIAKTLHNILILRNAHHLTLNIT